MSEILRNTKCKSCKKISNICVFLGSLKNYKKLIMILKRYKDKNVHNLDKKDSKGTKVLNWKEFEIVWKEPHDWKR